METSINRVVESVQIVSLYGSQKVLLNVKDAIKFISQYKENNDGSKFLKYEIMIKYNNGDKIDAVFQDKDAAIRFLRCYV